jgi:hypothetical protein
MLIADLVLVQAKTRLAPYIVLIIVVFDCSDVQLHLKQAESLGDTMAFQTHKS